MTEIEKRLAAIEKAQREILNLLTKQDPPVKNMTLKEAAKYVGYSPDHFRRLAVEQRIIPFSRPSGQQKGKLLFRKSDLDSFLQNETKEKRITNLQGRKRKSHNVSFW